METEQETEAAVATLPGVELARVLSNAHSMVPARAQHKHLMIHIGPGYVSAGGTDQYVAGLDYVEATTLGEPERAVSVDRDTLEDIERTARLIGKKADVRLEVSRQHEVSLSYWQDGERVTDLYKGSAPEVAVWDAVHRLMASEFSEDFPRYAAFSPALFARFAKVKGEGIDAMDVYWLNGDRLALVKLGRSFVGLVMPLDRTRSRKYCPEGHWD